MFGAALAAMGGARRAFASRGRRQEHVYDIDDIDRVRKGKVLVLFLGNGPRTQYKDVDTVMADLDPHLTSLISEHGRFIAVFGGDTYIPSKPDLGVIIKRVRDAYSVPLLGVVGWDDVDDHVDFIYRYESSVCAKTGRVLYGGKDEQGNLVVRIASQYRYHEFTIYRIIIIILQFH